MAIPLTFTPALHKQVESGPSKGAWVAKEAARTFAEPEKAEAAKIRAEGGIVVLEDTRITPEMQQAFGPLYDLLVKNKTRAS